MRPEKPTLCTKAKHTREPAADTHGDSLEGALDHAEGWARVLGPPLEQVGAVGGLPQEHRLEGEDGEGQDRNAELMLPSVRMKQEGIAALSKAHRNTRSFQHISCKRRSELSHPGAFMGPKDQLAGLRQWQPEGGRDSLQGCGHSLTFCVLRSQ